MADSKLTAGLKACRRAGVPLVLITSVDEPATVSTVAAIINSGAAVIRHDIVRGFAPVTEAAQAAIGEILGENDPVLMTNPQTAIMAHADRCPENACLCMIGTGRWIDDKGSQQAISNARDILKGKGGMIVLIGGPGLVLPADLAPDIVRLEDPAATPQQRKAIAESIHRDAQAPDPDAETLRQAVSATRGLSAYGSEQAIAMSISPKGLSKEMLWDRWRSAINSIPGLQVESSKETLEDIGGHEVLKTFARQVMAGKDKPSAVIRVDEIEKAIAGAGYGQQTGGDSSGTSQSIIGAWLTYMQEHDQTGIIAIGPPGSGKSLASVAIGSAGGVPTITMRPGDLKGSLVGQTEQNTAKCFGALAEIVGPQAFWIVTCNNLAALSPELQARFHYGVWFFDLPSDLEKKAIWKIWLAKYPTVAGTLPDDTNWVGREIKTCVQIAHRLNLSPEQAAAYVVPYAKRSAETLATLRQQATGRFLSTSQPGTYQPPVKTQPQQSRKFN